jgi:hypothetical protein
MLLGQGLRPRCWYVLVLATRTPARSPPITRLRTPLSVGLRRHFGLWHCHASAKPPLSYLICSCARAHTTDDLTSSCSSHRLSNTTTPFTPHHCQHDYSTLATTTTNTNN